MAGPASAAVVQAETDLPCMHSDALDRAALRLASMPHGAGAAGAPTNARVAEALRLEGAYEVWPQLWRSQHLAPAGNAAWQLGEEQQRLRLERARAWWAGVSPAARCGVAHVREPNRSDTLLVIAADHHAELGAVPLRGRTGQWVTVQARVPGAVSAPRAYVKGPHAEVNTLSLSRAGEAWRGQFALRAPGPFELQISADLGAGPRPVAEAWVFADVEPAPRAAQGEGAHAEGAPDLASGLRQLRAHAGLRALLRDASLDAVAQAHAAQMAQTRTLAHELGGSTPTGRLDAAHQPWQKSGENVAHAASEAEAHEALVRSPSHLQTMMGAEYTHVGIGVQVDPRDQSVWACEVFVKR